MAAKTFSVLAIRATHRGLFYTDCKEALKDAALREGDRPSVWDYEGSTNGTDTAPSVKTTRAIDLQAGKKVTKARSRNIGGDVQRLIAAGVVKIAQTQQARG